MTDRNILAYSEAKAYPTIGVILLGGISDKINRIPLHTSSGFAYTGADEDISVKTSVFINKGTPFGSLNGESVEYSESGRSPFVVLNRYRSKMLNHLGLNEDGLSVSFRSENKGVLSGSSDAGAAAMGVNIDHLSGGISDRIEFENELRSISESVGRSLYGGLTITRTTKGRCNTERILDAREFRDYITLGCRFNTIRNPSDKIHENIVNSPNYRKRIDDTDSKGKTLEKLAEDRDIKGIFDLAHQDTEEYHRLIESVGVVVIDQRMRALMDRVNEIRKEIWASYIVTGGSNVFVTVEKKSHREVKSRLEKLCDGISMIKVAGEAKIISRS
ncbi:MAG: diphosphomevalonate decarboxylase [Candidatus Thermoplasmatota archaeon]|nr:diphosphomevalonate decarboxylase [Candidatus Thermoplasmatota archaeon]MDA8143901.1 diphosphomevalonate decarboxylase [Thermoplasmatales archaeon]